MRSSASEKVGDSTKATGAVALASAAPADDTSDVPPRLGAAGAQPSTSSVAPTVAATHRFRTVLTTFDMRRPRESGTTPYRTLGTGSTHSFGMPEGRAM